MSMSEELGSDANDQSSGAGAKQLQPTVPEVVPKYTLL